MGASREPSSVETSRRVRVFPRKSWRRNRWIEKPIVGSRETFFSNGFPRQRSILKSTDPVQARSSSRVYRWQRRFASDTRWPRFQRCLWLNCSYVEDGVLAAYSVELKAENQDGGGMLLNLCTWHGNSSSESRGWKRGQEKAVPSTARGRKEINRRFPMGFSERYRCFVATIRDTTREQPLADGLSRARSGTRSWDAYKMCPEEFIVIYYYLLLLER